MPGFDSEKIFDSQYTIERITEQGNSTEKEKNPEGRRECEAVEVLSASCSHKNLDFDEDLQYTFLCEAIPKLRGVCFLASLAMTGIDLAHALQELDTPGDTW